MRKETKQNILLIIGMVMLCVGGYLISGKIGFGLGLVLSSFFLFNSATD